ncbi:MAG: carboxypeptidase regulatory-like domain-containing protein [Blastocatellia bacterium]
MMQKIFQSTFGSSLIALLLAVTVAVRAQSPQATVSGLVTDAVGAVVPGVRVTAVSAATGRRAQTTTNEQGFYVLAQLPIGDYTVEVEKEGFRKFVRRDLTLTTGATIALDVQLSVGEASDSVTVTGETPLLQTRTSEAGQLIESRAVQDLPLGDRRTMNLVRTVGGAVFVNYDAGAKPNFSLAGGRTQSQMFWIDGGSGQNMRLGIGQVEIDPPVEVTQEVKVLTNNYAAEYGGSAGGVIIATTKSGTNEFHGSLFEYFRNDALDAANFFAPIENGQKQKAPLRYNIFGGTIGDPVRLPKKAFGPAGYDGHNKTFFFFAYEGARRRDGVTRTLTVPTLLQRQGDFSQTFNAQGQLIRIYDPASTRRVGNATVRDQFAGNKIPAGCLDPVALKILDFYPLPNRAPGNVTGANNFGANYVQAITRDNFTVKFDHALTEKDKLVLRYLFNSDNRLNTSVFPNPAAETINDLLAHQQSYYLAWTRVFAPTVLNEFRFNLGARAADSLSQGLAGAWPSQLGLRGVPDGAFPQFVVAGVTNLGSGTHHRPSDPIRQYQFVNNLSWTRGTHAVKFGAEARRSSILDQLRSSISGSFSFNALATGLPGNATTGLGLASLLAGFPNSLTIRETLPLDRYSWYFAAFAQDDWTINQKLTLNLGLRWETDTPIRDRQNRMNGFDLAAINPVSGTPGVVRFAGEDGYSTSPYATDWNNFGPRFGFAWRPFKNTVVRGGAGIFFAHPFDHGAPTSASLGFEHSVNLSSPDNGITAPFFLRDGVPASSSAGAALDAGFGAAPLGRPTTTAVTFYERDRRGGYAQQFNFSVQHELPGSLLLEAAYLGNLSRKLASQDISLNQITPQKLAEIAARPDPAQRVGRQTDRPFPQFSNVSIALSAFGVSNYHALVLRAEKRFAAGFNLLSTYTWSKFLNDTDEGGASLGNDPPYSNYYDRRADYGPSANDIRHRLTVSSVYELPVGRGKRFLANNPLGYILGDWSIGVLALLQSGPPFTVTTQTNNTNAFSAGAQRADVKRDPNLPESDRRLDRWFDTTAFEQPAAFTFGTSGRGILRGDGIVNFDISILKNIRVSEQQHFQFRAELFNAFNHPNFGLPGATFGGPGFGVVSSAGAARSIQLGLRFVF